MKIGWLQIIMAVIYMGILIGVGLYMSRKVKSSDDFWIGGRQVGPVATALSYGAAYVSTVAIIGDPPMYYNYGLGYAAFEIMISVFFLLYPDLYCVCSEDAGAFRAIKCRVPLRFPGYPV